jgi:outer membrane protein TolC
MRKKIIAYALSIAAVMSLSVTAAAVGKMLSADMNLEALQKYAKKNTYSYKIYEYEKENAEINADNTEYELKYYEQMLKKTSQSDSKYYEYKLKIAELKKESELADIEFEYYDEDKEELDRKLTNLALKSKYYELCGLEKQVGILQANVDYLKKYAEVETVKLENRQSTETDCKLAQINLQMAENELWAAEKSVQSKTREISDFLNQYKNIEHFSVKCELPQSITYRKFDSKKLYKKFSEKNFELEKQRRSMEYDEDYLEEIENIYGKDSDTYKSYSNSYEIEKLNFEIKENEYKSQITEMVSSYEQAYAEYLSNREYNSVLADKLDILKTAYDTGNMSELDYLKQYAELSAEMNKSNNALAQADLLYDKLCLIEDGEDAVINNY